MRAQLREELLRDPGQFAVSRVDAPRLIQALDEMDAQETAPAEHVPSAVRDALRDALRDELVRAAEVQLEDSSGAKEPSSDRTAAHDDAVPTLRSLPTGDGDKSGATAQATPLPSGAGSASGMGESFSADLSSGEGAYHVPLRVPAGRNGMAPSVSLQYSSSSPNGMLGFGWSIGIPTIARQTDRGLPRYKAARDGRWHPEEDRFIGNGGQELVPVDSATAASIDGYASRVPSDLIGYQEYRAKVSGAFERFFRSPDYLRWVVLSKDGSRADYGYIPNGQGPPEVGSWSLDSVTVDEADPERTYRWALTRLSDAHGSTVYYRYLRDQGFSYVSEIFYLSPSSCLASSEVLDCQAPFSDYGVRVALTYEPRPDAFSSYASGFRVTQALRLRRVTVTSADQSRGSRYLVRRYHFTYDPSSFHSLLASVQLEGRPQRYDTTVGAFLGDARVTEASLGEAIVGELMPAMRFEYSRPNASSNVIEGFGGMDGTVRDLAVPQDMPSAQDALSDFFDVNSDGLPDLLVTNPARHRTPDGKPAVGVYFNGFQGADAHPATAGVFSSPIPVGVESGLADILSLANANVVPMDVDGDGRTDLLHMPRRFEYGYFTPTRSADGPVPPASPRDQGWRFTYARVELDSTTADPRIDLGADGQSIRAFDVNRDNLVDIVRTTGSSMQTWLNLGWIPGGEGRFGSAELVDGAWALSTSPIESCLLYYGNRPVDFGDSDVRLGDLNGDGLTDIVRMRDGRIVYWPGRGVGSWGDGPAECARGEGNGREIVMEDAPRGVFDEGSLSFNDVNMDGAADLVRVRYQAVDVWLNRAGTGFTTRITIQRTPAAPDFSKNIRFADVDGSATSDIVWAYAGRYQYVDLMGGRRPRLLTRIHNGLGAESRITYGSSADDYLRDLRAAATCDGESCDRFTWSRVEDACDESLLMRSGECVHRSAGSPVISTVVRAMETDDHMERLGIAPVRTRTEYAYHDGYYEGFEQEFRGFGAADLVSIGDESEPTVWARSWFHQGRRPSQIASDRLAHNPREALKGRAYLVEMYDERGVYRSTNHTSFSVRSLQTGLDGEIITVAFEKQGDKLRYDNAPFRPGTGYVELPSVTYESASSNGSWATTSAEAPHVVPVRAAGYALLRSTTDRIDNLGNVLERTQHGRVLGENGETPNERIVTHTAYALIRANAWMFRPTRRWVTGHGIDPARDGYAELKVSESRYNELGDEIASTSTVEVPRDVTFAGDGRAQSFVQTRQLSITSARVDGWGNVTAKCSGADLATQPVADCLTYREEEYDAPYGELPVLQRAAAARVSAGFRFLDTRTRWDRGLRVAAEVVDENGQRTTSGHDGLGRTAFVRLPAASEACSTTTTPTQRFAYVVAPNDLPITINYVYTHTDCGALTDDASVVEGRTYTDSMGRQRATLEESGQGEWVKSGLQELTARGSLRRAYQAAFIRATQPTPAQVLALPNTDYAEQVRDAFGRIVRAIAEDGSESRTDYHALSSDAWDAMDLSGHVIHGGTPTTSREDGHGRVIDQVQRNRAADRPGIEYHRLQSTYRADGSIIRAVRGRSLTDAYDAPLVAQVSRSFTYDSAGRRLASTDPDTTSASGATWRYLYNQLSQLVAVRDPRGCGQNFYYDHGGRLVGEDYVGCSEAQARSTLSDAALPTYVVALGTMSGSSRNVDVVHYFDALPPWATGQLVPPTSFMAGQLTGTADRGQRVTTGYNRRGLPSFSARQLALITPAREIASSIDAPPTVITTDGPSTGPSTRAYDERNTYVRRSHYDHAGRVVGAELPRAPDWGGPGVFGPTIEGRVSFNPRGLATRVDVLIGGVVHPVIRNVRYAATGAELEVVYGDDRGGARQATRSLFEYDRRLRPTLMTTLREATTVDLGDRPLGAVTRPFAQAYQWDAASNLLEVRDERYAREWPAGHRPSRVRLVHDALYHVVNAQFTYRDDGSDGGAPGWSPRDTAADWRAELTRTNADGQRHLDADPMRSKPAPLVDTLPRDRVSDLTWDWDWLGNTTEWTDDASMFYERSIGRIVNGYEIGGRPSALYLASDLPLSAGARDPTALRGGYLELDYGDSGNVVGMTVHGQCHDPMSTTGVCFDDTSLGLAARRSALRSRCVCEVEQHYQYRWDELNRLAEARRFDRGGGAGRYQLAARQRNLYDATNQRVVKQSLAVNSGELERVLLAVYPGELERRGVRTGATAYENDDVLDTENDYLVGGARIVWERQPEQLTDRALDRDARLVLAISDALNSTSATLDLWSGELLEYSTYYPNGARETYRTQDDESVAPEPMGFTGKEADEEVGLVYFGERYLIPRIGRWASPDPLHIHAMGGGEAGNSYHYVSGNLLQARDPLGLDGAHIADGNADDGRVPQKDGTTRAVGTPNDGIADSVYYDEWQPEVVVGRPAAASRKNAAASTSALDREAKSDEIAPAIATGMAVGSLGTLVGVGVTLACPVCGLGLAAYGAYELVSNAGDIASATGRLATGRGTVGDYIGLGGVLGGAASGPKPNLGNVAGQLRTWTSRGAPVVVPVPTGAPGISLVRINLLRNRPKPTGYSVAFEMQLKPSELSMGEAGHFEAANRALRLELSQNSVLSELVGQPQGWGRPPANWTWQHATTSQAQQRVGVMQLVPTKQHTPGSLWWRILHPGRHGAGGYAEWAVPAGAPKKR